MTTAGTTPDAGPAAENSRPVRPTAATVKPKRRTSTGSGAAESGSGLDLAFLIGAGFVLWGLYIGLGQISDNSFFTHLATGRLILHDGIPRHDPYSFTAAGEPWVVQSWLASWLYGFVDSWWGPAGLRVLMGFTTAGLAATSTLFGALSAGVRVRETLLPLLLIPTVTPVLIGATRAYEAALGTGGASTSEGWPWVGLLGVFALAYSAFGLLGFGALMEEA